MKAPLYAQEVDNRHIMQTLSVISLCVKHKNKRSNRFNKKGKYLLLKF